eukprot:67793-Pelagomonas_calceolata.AAC.1
MQSAMGVNPCAVKLADTSHWAIRLPHGCTSNHAESESVATKMLLSLLVHSMYTSTALTEIRRLCSLV